jgi:hypothetical protein
MIISQSNPDCGPLGCDTMQPLRVLHISEGHIASIFRAEGSACGTVDVRRDDDVLNFYIHIFVIMNIQMNFSLLFLH